MRTPRQTGVIGIACGLALGALSAVMVWKVIPEGDASRVVVLGFIVAVGLIVKGGVELILNSRWSDLSDRQTKVLQVLAFLALVAIAVGIAYYGMEME